MSTEESFWDFFKESTAQMFAEFGEAWSELKQDLKETGELRHIRPGAIGCCKEDGRKIFCILLGGERAAALNAEGEPEEMSIGEFRDQCHAPVLFVAGQKRLAVGAREISHAALAAIDEERYTNSRAFVSACLGGGEGTVKEQIESRFGSVAWLRYAPPECGE